jgi:hypothetical protein
MIKVPVATLLVVEIDRQVSPALTVYNVPDKQGTVVILLVLA